jgi:hypothetical protein
VQKLQKEKGQRVMEVTPILDVNGTVPRDFSLQVFFMISIALIQNF